MTENPELAEFDAMVGAAVAGAIARIDARQPIAQYLRGRATAIATAFGQPFDQVMTHLDAEVSSATR